MRYFILLVGLLVSLHVQAQDQKMNVLSLQAQSIGGDVSYGGYFRGNGYGVNYSRYVAKKLFADIGYGYYQYNGSGDSTVFVNRKKEESLWNMRHIRFGMGYNLVKSNRFLLKGKIVALFLTNKLVDEIWESDGEVTYRSTRRITDKTIELGLLGDYSLGQGWSAVAELSRGLGLQRYKTYSFKLGVAYSF